MKKLLFVPALLLLIASCGNLANQVVDNTKLATDIKTSFAAATVNVNSTVTNRSGSYEIEISRSALGSQLQFDEQRVATAVAVYALTKIGEGVDTIRVKIEGDSLKDIFSFDEKELKGYSKSAASADAYLTAMLKKDEAALLSNGNPEYLGKSAMPQVTTLAGELSALGTEQSRQLAGIMDSNIDNTTIPVHVVTYLVKFSGGEKRVCTFFVNSESDHKVAGFDIR
ncbi:MAG: hypothetical protein ACK5Z2_11280 [Bacteroidota bacterium]|jgi:hypothetical protein